MTKNKVGHGAVAKINKLSKWLIEMKEDDRRQRIAEAKIKAKSSRKSLDSVQPVQQ